MTALQALQRYVRKPQTPACELCALPIGPEHGHAIDLETREIQCICRPCSIALGGGSSGRIRGIPDRVRPADPFDLEALGIPVGLACIVRRDGQLLALLPSPGGPIEAELPNGRVPEFEPEVEAVVVRKERTGTLEAFVVPIDVCFRLVAIVRSTWAGIDGGDDARAAIAAFFLDLRKRGR